VQAKVSVLSELLSRRCYSVNRAAMAFKNL